MPYPDEDPGYEYPDRRDEPRNPPYVVVRFTRAVEPYDDGEPFAQQRLAGWKELGQLWEQLVKEFPGISLRPLFRSLTPDALKRLIASSPPPYGGDHRVNFLAYFQVVATPDTHCARLAKRLRDHPAEVETAYDQEIGLPPAVNASQFYLDPAPPGGIGFGGVDAKFAWTKPPGGLGEPIRIIDIERGWFLEHADFARPPPGPAKPQLLYGQPVRPSALHGTEVLGILYAQDGGGGDTNGVGIAPRARVDCVSYAQTTLPNCAPNLTNLEAAIQFAASQLGNGDVLLIEATVAENALSTAPAPGPSTPRLFLPVEAHDGCRDAIAQATARGITVVEAGGNGTAASDGTGAGLPPLNMDGWPHPITGKKSLWPNVPGYQDCGAIVVGAAALQRTGPPYRLAYSPLGLRLDCFGQGQGVFTTTCGAPALPVGCTTQGYISNYSNTSGIWFSGTSAAAAVIAGAVAVLQGIVRQRPGGAPLSPQAIRSMLKAPANGTPVFTAALNGQLAGSMPDLRKIIQNLP